MISLGRRGNRLALIAGLAMVLLANVGARAWAVTPVPMGQGNYIENFADIANWTNNFAAGVGANRYNPITAGTFPAPTLTTVFTSGSGGGVQKGTGNIVLLATGTTDNTTAAAFDLYLDFTGVTAGTISLDWAEVTNSTGDRKSTFKLQTNGGSGSTFSDLAGTSVTVTNNVASSGSLTNIALPAGFNNASGAVIRFYIANGTGGTTGSRPKISIDNVSVTRTCPSLAFAPVAGFLTAATVGTPYSQTITASGGTAPYTYAVTSGTLNSGLTLSSGGVLSGTPTAAGTSSFSVTATAANGCTGTVAYSLSATCPTLTLAPPAGALPNGTVNAPYSQTITTSGGTAPYTYTVVGGTLPTGLNVSSSGVISGTPTLVQNPVFTVRSTDAHGCAQNAGYSITIDCAPLTMSPPTGALPVATTGTPYSQTVTASGGTGPYTYAVSIGSLPPGLTLSTGGVISGTATATGTYNFTIFVQDVSGCPGSIAYSLTSNCGTLALAPAAGALPGATTGAAYSQTISASGGTAPYTFAVTAGALPGGLTLAPGGAISGTATAIGNASFTVTATDANGCTGLAAYTLDVGCPTLTLAPPSSTLPDGVINAAYSQTLTTTGGTAPYTYTLESGSLPTGLSVSTAGVISGTPTLIQNPVFTVRSTDVNGCFTSATYVIRIDCATATILPVAGALPGATTGTPYSQTLTASGNTAPYTYVVSIGALPPGLTLSTGGVISGTPTAGGNYGFTVFVSDVSGCSGAFAYTIDVTALPVHNVNSGLYFSTITAAINDAGTVAGNTIDVAAGTYEEQVVVDKALTIEGAGCGQTIIKSPPTLAASFDFGSGPRKPIVFVNGVNATIQNLTIDGAGRGNLNAAFIGLGFWNGGGKGANLCIQNVENTPFDGAQHGVGVYTYNNTGGPYALELDHVAVTDFQKNGMALSGNGMTVNVHDCTTTGKGYTAVTAQNGIQVGFGATGTVTACKVTDIGFTGTSAVASGIFVTEAAGSTTVSNLKGVNTINNVQAPINVYDSNAAIDGVDVTGGSDYGAIYAVNLNSSGSVRNLLTGQREHVAPRASAMDASVGAAILAARTKSPNQTMASAYALSVTNSCLYGSDAAGTVGIGADSYGGGEAVTATNNTVKDWDYGMAIYFAPATLTANLNSITSNVTAGFDGTANPTQDATRNWWGNAAGPSGGDACNGANFTPWIHSGTNLAASCGFTPPSFTIVASAGSNGAISPNGTTTEYTGDDQAYAITPDAGYAVADVVVDGSSQGPLTSYTFTNISANHTIAASFAPLANNTVTPVSVTACATPAHPCQTVPVNITRGDATGMRLFHVTFQLSANLQLCSTPGASITQGAYLSAANPNTTFLITPNGGGSYTVDGTINGSPCGATAASGNLFNISVAGTGTSGTGTVTITALTLRDCSNNTMASTIGGPASVTIDTTPVTVASIATPQNVTELSPLTITPSVVLTSCATGPVTWSVAPPLPTGATFNTTTGEIQWTPACGTAGTYGPFTLTATAASGDAGSSNAFSIIVAHKTYTIAASAGAGGTISPNGSVVVNCGANQTFTITPDACHTIADVLVDGVSVGAVTSTTLNNVTANHTVVASFNLINYTITASADPGGTISPSGAVVVGCDANQSFTITPDACHTIADVKVDGVSVGAVASYTFSNVGANHTIAASFNVITYTITASAGTGGSISPSGAVSVNCGANQAFTITPDACYSIADVKVDGVSVGAVASYTLNNVSANHTIAASFTLNTYTITASAGAGGTISPSGAVSVNCGANQTFTISASDPCHVIADVLVDGVSVGAVASYTFSNVGANHTIAASFTVLGPYTIAASAGAGGAISPSGSVVVNCDASQTFTITPDACHTIADVLVDGVSVGPVASYTFSSVQANHTIAASFTLNTYVITASAGAGGSISPSGAVAVNCGANQTFTITPSACHSIADVLVDGVSVGAVGSYTFSNVGASHTIAATFVLDTYTIAASAGAGGAISPSGAVSVNCGANQTFTITPDGCHSIADVVVDGNSVGAVASYTFNNVTGPHTIVASFTLNTYVIAASAGAGGSISPSGNVSVNCGANQAFTITPDACHSIADVVVDGNSVGAVASYTFNNVTGPHSIVASFTLNTYVIAASAGTGGVISPSGNVAVNCGANQTFSITPDGCHTIADVLVDGVSQGAIASYTFNNVTAPHTIAASFNVISYTITASAGAGGGISPSGTVSVNCGANQAFTITPDACHNIQDVLVDGVSQGAIASYTFPNVAANHTIAASFVHVPAVVSAPATVSATQVLLGNPIGADRTGITVHISSVPGAVTYKVYRAPFGHYPEYDDNGGAAPTAPTTWPPSAPWTLTSVTADGGVDTPPTRDFWYYAVYAQNACGDLSVASAMTGGTLDYHLGDVSDNVTPGHGDDLVDVADISLLGAHYGINLAPNDPVGYLDVGPTSTNYVDGRPLTDNRVDFEDLVMFAINYGEVTTAARTKPPVASDATPATVDQLSIDSPRHVQPGDDDVVVTLGASGTGRVQAASARLTWDPKVVDLVGWTPGEFLLAQNGMLLSAAKGALDLAILGQGQALTGTGAVATIRFKIVGAGDPAIGIASVDARDTHNAKVTMGATRIVAESVPTVTVLEPVAPNPSRGTATLSFSIARRSPVDIRIYSVDGRLVRNLFHGTKEPGVYSLTWDGRDDRGAAVGGGVFFARMSTDHAASTRTLTRVR